MKTSFMGKIRILIIILFLISLIQGMIILKLMLNFNDPEILKQDIQNTVLITIFLQFLLTVIIFFYLPVFLHNTFSEIHQILKDISQGNYKIEIDLENFEKNLDREFYAVILEIKKMLKSIITFDKLKKEKILEHHSRIISILNLTENGFIIVDINGNIVYINDQVTSVFSAISENINIFDTNFPPDIENNIKKYIQNLIKFQTKQETHMFFLPILKRHISLKSAIVRGVNGEMTGAVVSISNLEKKKQEKSKEKDPDPQ